MEEEDGRLRRPTLIDDRIIYNHDDKFDIQLSAAHVRERALGEMLKAAKIERGAITIELKSETWLWERTGNICIEYKRDGKKSGLSTTQADYWFHELIRAKDPADPNLILMPVRRLKRLAREAIHAGQWRGNSGDDGRSTVALIDIATLIYG